MTLGRLSLVMLALLTVGCASEWLQVDAGTNWTCGIDSNSEIQCWGDIDPTLPPPPGTFSSLSIGTEHGCAINSAGTIGCWGPTSYGKVGDIRTGFLLVSAGGEHNCGITSDYTVECWGRDEDGESTAPEGGFTQVSAGGSHSCAIDNDGAMHCWGCWSRPDYGQCDPPPSP